jgi:hypothetical protein
LPLRFRGTAASEGTAVNGTPFETAELVEACRTHR